MATVNLRYISATRARGSLARISLMGLLFCLTAFPLASRPAQNSQPASGGSDVHTLIKEVIHNEIEAEVRDQSLWRYREVHEEGGKKKLLDVIQTKDGEIQRLLAINGQPLAPKQRQTEDQHIQSLVSHPQQLQQLKKKQHDDAEQMRSLLKMFPEAFQFENAGMQGNLVKIKFAPNPKFHPATRPAQVFHHLSGSLLVDGKQKRIAEINGQLTSEVKFGGGFLGHLDKGGTFAVKQQDVGSGHWEMTNLDIRMNGKALFFKTLAVREKELNTDFRRLPDDTTPRKAAELLTKDIAKIENASAK